MPANAQTHVWSPFTKCITHAQNILINCTDPRRIESTKFVEISEICKLLAIEDIDWPFTDFNFNTRQWVAIPQLVVRDEYANKQRAIWFNATLSAPVVVRFFRQFGWEITFTNWNNAPASMANRAYRNN